jgi:hypothetical protein
MPVFDSLESFFEESLPLLVCYSRMSIFDFQIFTAQIFLTDEGKFTFRSLSENICIGEILFTERTQFAM